MKSLLHGSIPDLIAAFRQAAEEQRQEQERMMVERAKLPLGERVVASVDVAACIGRGGAFDTAASALEITWINVKDELERAGTTGDLSRIKAILQ
jgi:hypothetical protein